MQCPKCRFENREGAKFCKKCGSRFSQICTACGYMCDSESLFCDECGQDLRTLKEPTPIDYDQPQSYTPKHLADKILNTRSALEGERKLVTVLFADVAGFTSLSEKLEPEEVHQIMEGCLKILMDAIHKYEGTINQFTGDGVMALFGAPLAHEDHAQRACYAALAIQKDLVEYSEKIQKDYGQKFRMRIGLNSGLVVVGSIGDDLHMDYTAIGDTINLASRMEGLAHPGTVLLSRNTHRLVKDYFDLNPIGPLEVKGKEEPQEAFELVKADVRTRFQAGLMRGITQLVGRKPELETLQTYWDQVKAGNGQILDVIGEAGVGKSRLVYEFQKNIQEEATLLTGICIRYGRNINFLPVIDIVKGIFGIVEGLTPEETYRRIETRFQNDLGSTIPFYQGLLSLPVKDPTYHGLSPEGRKFGTFEALKNLLQMVCRERPVLLFLDDVHWMDKLSEEFFAFFSHSLPGLPILMLSTYRPEGDPPWTKVGHYKRLGLETLSPQSSLRLISNILGGLNLESNLDERIVQKTGGNPFFMEETIRYFLERKDIVPQGNIFVPARPLNQIEIPETVQGVLADRMDRLSEDLKKTMQVASVIGRDFAFKLLRSIMDLGDELRIHLTNLVGLEILYEKTLYPELEYIFKHALTQEVAYESLLKQKRREIHGRIARTIEELYADRLEEHYETLVHHYELSGEIQQTLKYLILAGEKANRNMAIQSADAFFTKAIQIGESNPEFFAPEDRAKSYLSKGNAELALGNWSDLSSYFRKCNEISREHGLVEYEMKSLNALATTVYFLESEQEANDINKEALTRARHFKNLSLESIALGVKAVRIALHENPLRGYEEILKSQEIALKSGDPVAIGVTCYVRAYIERWLGQPAKAIESSEGLFEVFMALFEYTGALFLISPRGLALAEVGRISEAIELIESGIDISLRSSSTLRLGVLYNCLGFCYSEICLPERAWGFNLKAESISGEEMRKFEYGRRQHAEAYAQSQVNLMENLFDQGQADKAWNLLDPFKVQTKSTDFDMGRIHREARLGYLEARMLIQRGDLDQAEKLTQAFMERSEEKGMNKRFGGFLRLWGEIRMKRGEAEKAVETLHRSAETLKKVGNRRQIWTAHTSLASAYRLFGRGSEEREQWHMAKFTAEAMTEGIHDNNLKKAFLNTDPIQEIYLNAYRP
ncbi:MAG: AAA family ATPase [Deltaproteobacteria bacterium]|nr:AAA family ATPase [Deltaproteobacteria bacterium]